MLRLFEKYNYTIKDSTKKITQLRMYIINFQISIPLSKPKREVKQK